MTRIPRTLKILALFLAVVLFVQIVPQIVVQSLASEIASAFEEGLSQENIAPDEEAEILYELTNRRTENEKQFRMSDGSTLLAQYADAVHYNKDGIWTDIDNTLNADGEEYVASENAFTVRFAKNGNTHKLLELSLDQYNIRFGLSSGKSSAGVVTNPKTKGNNKAELQEIASGIRYNNILDGVDIEYLLIGSRIKENIIVSKPLESYAFSFDLKLRNLTAELQTDGRILLKDGSEALWEIPAPFAFDANGAVTNDVFFALEQKGNSGNYILTVTLSSAWAKTAAFPITIDPLLNMTSITSEETGDSVSGNLITLNSSNNLYANFSIDSIPDTAIIGNAKATYTHTSPTLSGTVRLYARKFPVGHTGLSEPSTEGEIVSYATYNPDDKIILDITEIVNGWMDGSIPSGFYVTYEGSGSLSVYKTNGWASTNPTYIVEFYDSVGIENYYSYATASEGRISYAVKHATGDLTAIYGEVSAETSTSPLELFHAYNSALVGSSVLSPYGISVGNGWKLSVQQYIQYYDGGYYSYLDADGTTHYFHTEDPNLAIYHDEDGLGLTLSYDSGMWMLEDAAGNFLTFTGGGVSGIYFLNSLITADGQQTTYTYDSSVAGKLTRITNSRGNACRIDFTYSGNRLSSATYTCDGKIESTFTYSYDSSGQLISITEGFPDADSGEISSLATQFTYSNGKLTQGTTGRARYAFTYAGNRVATMTQYGSTGGSFTQGSKIGFTYYNGLTRIRTAGTDDVYGTSDDLYTNYVCDNFGRTRNVSVEDHAGKVIGTYAYEYSTSTDLNLSQHKITAEGGIGATELYGESLTDNLLIDGDFESSSEWKDATYTTAQAKIKSRSLKLTNGTAYQSCDITNCSATDDNAFIVSAWAKADSMHLGNTGAQFAILVTLLYNEGTESYVIPFVWACDEWQYVSAVISAKPKTAHDATVLESIIVTLQYTNNRGSAYFDGVSLTKCDASFYEYNAQGKATSASSSLGSTASYSYNSNNDLTSASVVKGNGTENTSIVYSNTGTNPHRILSATNPNGIKTSFTYNSLGLVTGTTISKGSVSVSTSATYDGKGLVLSETDTQGNTTTYSYNNLLLAACSAPASAPVRYQYDGYHRVTRVYADLNSSGSCSSADAYVDYTYSAINAGSYLTGVTTPQSSFAFQYDAFGNVTKISSGSSTLAQYVYGANNGKLASMTFGNGASEQYEYDALDNLSSLCYNNSSTPAFTWTYDLSGLLKSRYDAANRITETYEYDSYSRLSSSTVKQLVDVYDEYEYEPSGTSLVTRLTTTYAYDNYGRTASVGYAFANKSYTRSVVYGLSDRINSYTVSGALSKVNSYDALNRLSNVSLKNASNSEVIVTSYDYNGMLPSSEISSFTEFYYTYDAANRITRIAEYGDDFACYAYDAQGQLIREDNAAANKTWVYTYDNYGNILTKSTYDFSTDDLEFLGSPSSVKTWSYTSSSLGKQLSHVDYDAIGNPIFDGERAWTYTWNGRLLTEIMGDGGNPIFQAKYNEDGIRTHKAYSEDGSEFTYHDYILEGTLILQEHAYSFYSSDPWEDPVTYYTNYYYYDENGSLVGLNYNGTNYYYYKNILGDILGIVNSSGELVVEYAYDAWGNIISTTGSMASTLGQANPFRYRGYYYDAETGFYYLNSRYYDPSACRFINADSYVSTGQGILGNNMYAYCGNNPVNRKDPTGQFWITALIITAVVAVCTVTLSGCSAQPSTPPNYVQENSANQNCYSYAFDLPHSANPGDFSARGNSDRMFYDKNIYTPEEIIKFIERDMDALNKSVRVVDSPKDKLDNEYIVAMKTSTIIIPFLGIADYHFAVQLSDGSWADKPGPNSSRWNVLDGAAIAWDLGNIKNYYNTETVYFAVGR